MASMEPFGLARAYWSRNSDIRLAWAIGTEGISRQARLTCAQPFNLPFDCFD
jgi:hypothetical protein